MTHFFFALRRLRKTPVFTGTVLLTLALGIGASTAIFSLIERIFLSPLSFPEPANLIQICSRRTDRPTLISTSSVARFRYYIEHQAVFSGITAVVGDAMALTGVGDPAQIFGQRVTSNHFEVLGVKPIRGRLFTAEEEKPGNTAVIVTEGFWRQRLGADSEVIGRVVTLNGIGHTIIGVVPNPPTAWSRTTELWTTWPFSLRGVSQTEIDAGLSFLVLYARLKPGISFAQAQSSLEIVGSNYDAAYSKASDSKRMVVLRTALDQITGEVRPAFVILTCAAVSVLLIACSNVANLLLVRFIDRQREMAVRMAIGATRAELLRLFLTESVTVGLVGGISGVPVAIALLKLVPTITANLLPIDTHLEISWTLLAFALAMSLLAGLAVGIFPALQGTRPDLVTGLREGGRSSTPSRLNRRFRTILLAAQVTVCVALLAGAGVLLRTFDALQHQSLGFQRERLFMAAIDLPGSRYPDGPSRSRFADALVTELQRNPGLERASVVAGVPFTSVRSNLAVARADGSVVPFSQRPLLYMRSCTPGYFQTLGIPLVSGRDFGERDTPDSTRVVILSRTTAERFFPREDPIGQHVLIGNDKGTGTSVEIIGVVGSIRSASLRKPEEDEIYCPWSQRNIAYVQIVARTRGRPEASASEVRAAVLRLDVQLPVIRQTTMENAIDESLGQNRLLVILVGLFAGLAFVLAAIGIYSVVAYTVAQRTSEIGIRMIMGARKRDVVRLVMIQGLRPVIVGCVFGLALTFWAKSLIASQVFGVSPLDPTILSLSILAIVLAAAAACWFPATRAARVDPLQAIRTE